MPNNQVYFEALQHFQFLEQKHSKNTTKQNLTQKMKSINLIILLKEFQGKCKQTYTKYYLHHVTS